MLSKKSLTLAALLSLSAAYAAPVDPAKSQVRFGFTQMNVPVEGHFKKVAGDISFDLAKPETGKVSLSVELASVDAGSPDANEALKSKEWFDLSRFPRASFSAAGFKSLGGNKFQATGQFSLKGRTANLTVPFTARAEGNGHWLEGSFPLSRLAYKVGEGEWADVGAVADQVQVKFKLFVPR
ncbi:YceI family protein [Chitinimonas lacunae]|uniref:YceI family protein n=1 Tax=Chitinimonas lacunae TaxID=1963018 RepID=A0ABV8MRP3_9NEIS